MNITVYLPDSLGRAIKASTIPVSRVCQDALRRELEAKQAGHRQPLIINGAHKPHNGGHNK